MGLSSYVNWFVKFMADGGVFMYVIATLWAIGLAIAIERLFSLKGTLDCNGPSFMNELQRYVLTGDIQTAIHMCSGSNAALPKVMKAGLKRAGMSIDQMQNAIEATTLEMIAKVEKRLNIISVLCNIATLFGLLGTIQGLIGAFSSLSAVDPAQKAEVLGRGISVAMHTTALGLFAAVTLMLIHAFLVARADKIVNEMDEFSAKLVDMLSTKKNLE